MRNLLCDLKRAIFSGRMLIGIVIIFLAAINQGVSSNLFQALVPLVCAFPYASALLDEVESGYVKAYLSRTGYMDYMLAKLLACLISGGMAEAVGVYLASFFGEIILQKEKLSVNIGLVFVTAAFWAVVSATLCVVTKSRYVAYGGGFVIYYLFIILYERYFSKLYCIYPIEWYEMKHTWILNEWGIVIMLLAIVFILSFLYVAASRRLIGYESR